MSFRGVTCGTLFLCFSGASRGPISPQTGEKSPVRTEADRSLSRLRRQRARRSPPAHSASSPRAAGVRVWCAWEETASPSRSRRLRVCGGRRLRDNRHHSSNLLERQTALASPARHSRLDWWKAAIADVNLTRRHAQTHARRQTSRRLAQCLPLRGRPSVGARTCSCATRDARLRTLNCAAAHNPSACSPSTPHEHLR